MIDGKRQVRENELAILKVGDSVKYYKRINGAWVYDNELMTIINNKDLCNVHDKCIYVKNKCQEMLDVDLNNEEEELNIILNGSLDSLSDEKTENYTTIKNLLEEEIETLCETNSLNSPLKE